MKLKSIALIAALPAVFSKDYQVPDLEYNNEDANCDNVNTLIAATTADLTRFNNYVTITLPQRSSKLNDAYASAMKTCTVIKSKRPALIQTTKLQTDNVNRLHEIIEDIQLISKSLTFGKKQHETLSKSSTFGKKQHETLSKSSTFGKKQHETLSKSSTFGKKQHETLSKSSTFGKKQHETLNLVQLSDNYVSPTSLCNDVKSTIIDLKNYIRFLIPAIKDTYINGILSDRLKDLNELNQECIAANCEKSPTPGPEPTPSEEEEETVEEESDDDDDKPHYDPAQCEDANYVGYKNIGSEENDITRFPNYSIAQLKDWCNANDECVAFSSLGYVKKAIKPLSKWADRSMYPNYQFCVKRSTEIPAEPVYNPLECEDDNYVGFKNIGSEGNDILQLSGKSIAQLKEYCDSRSDCVAFSSLGYIKKAIKPLSKWADRSSYKNYQFCVKKSTPISQ